MKHTDPNLTNGAVIAFEWVICPLTVGWIYYNFCYIAQASIVIKRLNGIAENAPSGGHHCFITTVLAYFNHISGLRMISEVQAVRFLAV